MPTPTVSASVSVTPTAQPTAIPSITSSQEQKPKYATIVYDGAGATAGEMDTQQILLNDEGYLLTQLAPNTFIKEGFRFCGWQYNGDFYAPEDNVLLTEGIFHVKALWEKVYTVVLNAMGGNCEMESISFIAGEEILLPKAEKTDMYFEGWFLEEKAITKVDNVENLELISVLYAAFSSFDCSQFVLELNGDGYDLKGYTGMDESVTAPAIYKNLYVKRLFASTFAGNTAIKNLTCPSTIMQAQGGFLAGCSSLEVLSIGGFGTLFGKMFEEIPVMGTVNFSDLTPAGWQSKQSGNTYYRVPYGPYQINLKWVTYYGTEYLYQGEEYYTISETTQTIYDSTYSYPSKVSLTAYAVPKSLKRIEITYFDYTANSPELKNFDWCRVICKGKTIFYGSSGDWGSSGY